LEANLTKKDTVEKIEEHFGKISQEYNPFSMDDLAEKVKDKLKSGCEAKNCPELDELDVFEIIVKAKKPKSGVPGNLPRKLVQEFSLEMSAPLKKIYNNIITRGLWPSE
jgi:hypothetical protein